MSAPFLTMKSVMITRDDGVDQGRPSCQPPSECPLEQLDRERRDRADEVLAALDQEFAQAFRRTPSPAATGPEPWCGFLDLSLL